jgi:Domain of unknown function (DUF4440)
MKRCPTCNKTFTDQNLSFCVDDGTPLVPAQHDDELTEIGAGSNNPRTPPAYQPPSYVPPGDGEKRRNWPWVVGIISLLMLLLVGCTAAAVVLIPRLLRNSAPVLVSNRNANDNSNDPENANSNSESESHSQTNTSQEEDLNNPPPTDKDVVLAQLTDLEHEWTVANLNADKKKLDQILADDYVSPRADGKMQGKAEYINTIERDTTVEKWEFDDLRLTLRGDRATLLGNVRFQIQDRELVYDFVDRFVWREGRWQATGSEVSLKQ